MASAAGGERLFFALWPDEALRARLAAHRPTQGRPVPVANLHVTLLFLGTVGAAARSALEQGAAEIHAPAFELVLDRCGHWARAGICWLGASQVPDALQSLHEALRALAQGLEIPLEHRRYAPHVTLARRAPRHPVQAIAPIAWPVRDFVLVRSRTGGDSSTYEVLRRWPSGNAQAGPTLRPG